VQYLGKKGGRADGREADSGNENPGQPSRPKEPPEVGAMVNDAKEQVSSVLKTHGKSDMEAAALNAKAGR